LETFSSRKTVTEPTGIYIDPATLRERLPRPHLPGHDHWEQLYWRAWELGAKMVRAGTPENGFAAQYVDAAFGGNIFQWDTCFIAAFARYSRELLPILPALDNFYARQEPDGYIAREYRWENGANLWAKASGDSCNPPLFAWAEWLVYRIHGDADRLRQVWPHLDAYYQWLVNNRRLDNGLYWITDMGSGMDNTPRFAAAWADYSIQQALNALMMSKIAAEIGDAASAERYRAEHADLAGRINALMWDEADGMYWDLDAGNLATKAKTVAPFWALLAEITAPEQAVRLIAHLKDPQTFWRPHPFPTLAADERWYKPFGDYWLGAVWAPTNYMIVRGLHAVGDHTLARESTARHLDAMAAVLESTGTIWENYRADDLGPGLPARPDFVGWSGLGPIAMLIETILGVELDAPSGTVTWRIPLAEGGIERLPWRGGDLDLTCTADSLRITATRPLKLVLLSGDRSATHDLAAGEHSLERPL
jgi:glycogen debranching enzyme